MTHLPIKSIRIGRDPLTNTSRGICYVEMNSVVDARFLHNQLLGEPPTIDGKLVSVSYLRTVGGNQAASAACAALAAAQWSNQGNKADGAQPASAGSNGNSSSGGANYSEEDIERMAKYSAETYAKTPEEKKAYLEYYRNYYRNGGDAKAAAATASSEESAKHKATSSEAEKKPDLGTVTVNGVEYKKYRESLSLAIVCIWRRSLFPRNGQMTGPFTIFPSLSSRAQRQLLHVRRDFWLLLRCDLWPLLRCQLAVLFRLKSKPIQILELRYDYLSVDVCTLVYFYLNFRASDVPASPERQIN